MKTTACYLLLAILIGWLPMQLSAQSLCQSFDDTTVPSANKQHAFDIYGNGHSGFLQNWLVTSGTPNIYGNGDFPNVNAYDGGQYAMMGVCDAAPNYSEGLSLKYNFQQGQSYKVSMAIRNVPINTSSTIANPIDVQFVLLQNAINYTYNYGTGCSPTPAIPSGSWVVDSLTHYDHYDWQVISFVISNAPSAFTNMWIRSAFSAGSPLSTTFLCIDSVCIQPYTPPVAGCYSFDDDSVPAANGQQAFNIYGNGNPGFLQDWHVTSGTPSIEHSGEIPGVNAYSGNQYALLGACDVGYGWSEGLSLSYPFQQGASYTVSMAGRNVPITSTVPNPIDVQFILLPDTITYPYNSHTGCSPTPGIPAGAVIVNTLASYVAGNWQIEHFNISNVPGHFTQLWIRVSLSSGSPLITSAFCFDSLCIQPYTPTTACYSFDDDSVPAANGQQAFNIYGNGNPGFLQDWHVTSGTPSIEHSGEIPGINAYSGNQYALLGACDVGYGWSEGLSLAYPFQQGSSYTVSMAGRNVPITSTVPNPIDVQFILLPDTINYPYNSHTGCSPTPGIPAGAVIVNTLAGYVAGNWQIEHFNIINVPGHFTQLWIRVSLSNGSPLITSAFCFDSLCIKPYNGGDVWPGDADNDGLANNFDILTLGQGYLHTGVTRPNASLVWSSQYCTDWANNIPGGQNEKYADCDGNGTINADDTLAVVLNYGLTHQKASSTSSANDPSLYVNFPANYTVTAGQLIDIPVYLGTSSTSINSIYGLAFSVNYDTSLIVRNSAQLITNGSWIGTGGIDMLAFHKDLYDNWHTDIALVRTDHSNTNGFGQICTLRALTKVDMSGGQISKALVPVISGTKAITHDGTIIPLNYDKNDTAWITKYDGIQNTPQSDISLHVYPNPAQQYMIADPGNVTIQQYSITDMMGREMLVVNGNYGATRISLSSLSAGIYFLRAQSGNDVKMVRFTIVK